MPKYLIEREIPGAGKLSAQELQAISQKSCGILDKMGSQIQWIQSYVTDDKVYCIYIAPNPEMVLEHAQQRLFHGQAIRDRQHRLGHDVTDRRGGGVKARADDAAQDVALGEHAGNFTVLHDDDRTAARAKHLMHRLLDGVVRRANRGRNQGDFFEIHEPVSPPHGIGSILP